jgi:hypothetical protein
MTPEAKTAKQFPKTKQGYEDLIVFIIKTHLSDELRDYKFARNTNDPIVLSLISISEEDMDSKSILFTKRLSNLLACYTGEIIHIETLDSINEIIKNNFNL